MLGWEKYLKGFMGFRDGWVMAKKEVGVGGSPLHPCMDSIPSHYMLLFLVEIPCQYKI